MGRNGEVQLLNAWHFCRSVDGGAKKDPADPLSGCRRHNDHSHDPRNVRALRSPLFTFHAADAKPLISATRNERNVVDAASHLKRIGGNFDRRDAERIGMPLHGLGQKGVVSQGIALVERAQFEQIFACHAAMGTTSARCGRASRERR